jgi:hypothetical protein
MMLGHNGTMGSLYRERQALLQASLRRGERAIIPRVDETAIGQAEAALERLARRSVTTP